MAAAICAFVISDPPAGPVTRATCARATFLRGWADGCVNIAPARKAGQHMDSVARWTPQWDHAAPLITTRCPSERNRAGSPRRLGRPARGRRCSPFKDLEVATRSRLNYRALTDA